MRVLVTGAAGFIGSHLCNSLLAEGHDVVALDNLFTGSLRNLPPHPRLEFIRHDVCEPFHLDCEELYHLACPASPVHYQRNPVRTIKTAVIGTVHALECARDVGAKVLLASTSEVYGDPEVNPQTERYWGHVNPVGPRACYDEGKRAAEALGVSWAKQYRTDVRIARIFNTYGPNMAVHDGRLIPNFIMQALANEPFTIYGSGVQTRSFCYVEDTVRGLIALVRTRAGCAPVNIGNPEERTILDVAREIGRHFQATRLEYRSLPEDDPQQRCPDISVARDLLDWAPQMGFPEGIARTVQYYKAVRQAA